jgi:hypothetical protein
MGVETKFQPKLCQLPTKARTSRLHLFLNKQTNKQEDRTSHRLTLLIVITPNYLHFIIFFLYDDHTRKTITLDSPINRQIYHLSLFVFSSLFHYHCLCLVVVLHHYPFPLFFGFVVIRWLIRIAGNFSFVILFLDL